MADNVMLNSENVKTLYQTKVIVQSDPLRFWGPLIGKKGDKNAFVYVPDKRHEHGNSVVIPLRKSVTDDAITDGGTYEGQGKKPILSSVSITIHEYGQVFGGHGTYEEGQTDIDLRDECADDASEWYPANFDKNGFTTLNVTTPQATFPSLADRGSSQYNVEYGNDATSWNDLDAADKLTPKGISRMKVFFKKRGIRPGQVSPNEKAYIYIGPSEALFDLQHHPDYKDAITDAMRRNDNHILFRGHGLNPWGMWDNVYLVEDSRPVYGGDHGTFLHVTDEGTFIKYEGLFLGAQGIAWYERKVITWFERLWDHDRKFEVSVHSEYGFAKTVLNRGTLASPDNRDYGAGYGCFAATKI